MPRRPGFVNAEAHARYAQAYDATLASAGVPVRSRDIPTAFGSTHVLEAGAADKPPLLLLHAMSFSAASWVRNLAGLSEHRRVIAVDTIGDVNLSRSERAVRGVDDYARWLAEVLGALGVKQTAVAGNSYGGWLAAHLARLRPELVSHLVLISPAVVFVKFRPAFYRQAIRALIIRSPAKAESFARWFVTDAALQNSSARLWLDQMGQGLPFFRGLLGFPRPRGPLTDAELGSISAPVLSIEGESEPIHDPAAAIARAEGRLPSVTTALLAGAAHLAALEQPERVNELILNHLVTESG